MILNLETRVSMLRSVKITWSEELWCILWFFNYFFTFSRMQTITDNVWNCQTNWQELRQKQVLFCRQHCVGLWPSVLSLSPWHGHYLQVLNHIWYAIDPSPVITGWFENLIQYLSWLNSWFCSESILRNTRTFSIQTISKLFDWFMDNQRLLNLVNI